MVYAIDFKTGRIRWEREVRRALPNAPRHLKNSYASETPVTDGERVYVYFGNVGLFVFDMNGRPQWSKDFGQRQHAQRLGHCRLARSSPRPSLHRQRQRHALVHGRIRCAHGHARSGE